MRPKICVPIVASAGDDIVAEAKEIAGLPVELAEWRIDFFAGAGSEIPHVVEELKKVLGDKELIVTLRTVQEGGEDNGRRFDYFPLIDTILRFGLADYVDVEIDREEKQVREILSRNADSPTKVIGSFHDFEKTPTEEEIIQKLDKARLLGCHVGKLACMPLSEDDVDILLSATDRMRGRHPEFPLITMSMGELGEKSRLYGGLYGSVVSFGCMEQMSAPGQMCYEEMLHTFDRIYSGERHISLIGFMGAGKSTVAEELERQSGLPGIDTDRWIVEQEKRTIPEIFETEGEAFFRDLETAMIDEVASAPSILSCGGGMALRDINVRKLQEIGEVVFLMAEPETIFDRVRHSNGRPLLRGNMNVDFIREMMEKRLPYYEKAATVKVKTDGRAVSDIAKEILEKCAPV